MYDFKLITILVLDDFGEGIPVAWAISNREDAIMLVEFLGAIKYRTGPLKPPCWFMSDDAEQPNCCVLGMWTDLGEMLLRNMYILQKHALNYTII